MKDEQRKAKHAFWQRHLCDWRETGLTVKKYCQNHSLPLSQFKYYQYQLAPETKKMSRQKPAMNFVQVSPRLGVEQSASSDQTSLLSITTPRGYRVELGSIDMLVDVLSRLEA